MLATQSPCMPLATETGERCFTSPIDQIGLTGIFFLTFWAMAYTGSVWSSYRNYTKTDVRAGLTMEPDSLTML